MKNTLLACSAFLALCLSGCMSLMGSNTLSDEEINAEISELIVPLSDGSTKNDMFALTERMIANKDKCTISLYKSLPISPDSQLYWDGACKNGVATGLGQLYVRGMGVKADYLIEAGYTPKIYFQADLLNKNNAIIYQDDQYYYCSRSLKQEKGIVFSQILSTKGNNDIINYLYISPLDEFVKIFSTDWNKSISLVQEKQLNQYKQEEWYSIRENGRNEANKSNNYRIFAHNAKNNVTARYNQYGQVIAYTSLTGSFVPKMKQMFTQIESEFKSSMVKYMEEESTKKINQYVNKQCRIKRNVPSDVIDSGYSNICNIKKYTKDTENYLNKEIPKLLAEKYSQQEQAMQAQQAQNERERLIRAQEMQAYYQQQRMENEQRQRDQLIWAEQQKANAIQSMSNSIWMNSMMPRTHYHYFY